MSKPTLKSVAKALGVSTATISNAFNRPDQLSLALREKILSACAELGYDGPNKAAQSLRKGSSGIVAVILSDSLEYMVSDPVASQFLQGVARELERQSKHLLLYSGSADNLDSITDFVDGFICYGAPRNLKLIEQLKRCPKRVLTVDFDLPGRPSVNIDNEQAAYDSAMAVLKPGDRVAVLGLRLIDAADSRTVGTAPLWDNQSSVSHRRLDGYQRAMQQLGLTLSNELLWHLPESNQACAETAAKAVLSQSPAPTVLLCMSDLIALSAMRVALGLGLRIPEQLRVVGFDGIEETLRYHPTLSSVWQFSDQKGEAAARAFQSGQDDNQLLPYELRLGESS
ncbi:LacI family DNA-binding transcriptional regulator [Alkalimonas sp. MEB108]|uniref:LacI family DNA-binding transcriptional regulator n=1 Tax=Alkalimonas cellulosilytica TaxID=3058395 RepID=A0ABU7J704_9GAMM|nr:LacI family DNA-binding transcriptional regulator [Alkalimonas sp. MEB108]MEE2002291.1 LacI family DNA-binding transcriptional regulator [Alkalimonas sp. MEB108]